MFYAYVMRSNKDSKLYIGYTKDVERRVKDHNNGWVYATKLRRPFELIYLEGYKAEQDARRRERNLKLHSRALGQLKKRLANSLR
ncbi:GIY-YIG nuclease family protein [Candidatus Omnitrophota bacterium]